MAQILKKRSKDKSYSSKIGKRIREERLFLNLTQERLAEDVGLSTAYIGQIERGDRSLTLDNLIIVAKRLGVTVDYLLSDCIPIPETDEYRIWNQLMNNRVKEQKELAINLLKILFHYIDNTTNST